MNNRLRGRGKKSLQELKPILDRIVEQVETASYIENDPVQFMHAFESKKDMEIAGFLAALMAWGRRDVVLRKTAELLERMEYKPYPFVMTYSPAAAETFQGFKHRTFKPVDIHGFLSALHRIYSDYPDFEAFWKECYRSAGHQNSHFISIFRNRFLALSPEIASRTQKHLSDPAKNSTCKRLSMFLRWTVRKNSPVDPGIWDFLPQSELTVPFDVHVARQSRRLGLLTRKSNDWNAVTDLTNTLRLLDPEDPARYDFALFGLGALGYSVPSRFLLNSQGYE